jgi:hypothetical protein
MLMYAYINLPLNAAETFLSKKLQLYDNLPLEKRTLF